MSRHNAMTAIRAPQCRYWLVLKSPTDCRLPRLMHLHTTVHRAWVHDHALGLASFSRCSVMPYILKYSVVDGKSGEPMRSFWCVKASIITSASATPLSMSSILRRHSVLCLFGNKVLGGRWHRISRTPPKVVKAVMSERATRLCLMSPTIATESSSVGLYLLHGKWWACQALPAWVGAPAVACVDDGNIGGVTSVAIYRGRPTGRMTHHKHIGTHRLQILKGITQSLAFVGAWTRDVKVWHISTQAFLGGPQMWCE